MAIPLISAVTQLAGVMGKAARATGVANTLQATSNGLLSTFTNALLAGFGAVSNYEKTLKSIGQTQTGMSDRLLQVTRGIESNFPGLSTDIQTMNSTAAALEAGMYDVGYNTVALLQQQKQTGKNEVILASNLRMLTLLTGMNSDSLDLFSNRAISLSERYGISTSELAATVRDLGVTLQQYRLVGVSKEIAVVGAQLAAVIGPGSQDIVNHVLAFISNADNISKMAILGITEDVNKFFVDPTIGNLLGIIRKSGEAIEDTSSRISSGFGSLDIQVLEKLFGTGANSLLTAFDGINNRAELFSLNNEELNESIEKLLADQTSASMKVLSNEQLLIKALESLTDASLRLANKLLPELYLVMEDLQKNIFPPIKDALFLVVDFIGKYLTKQNLDAAVSTGKDTAKITTASLLLLNSSTAGIGIKMFMERKMEELRRATEKGNDIQAQQLEVLKDNLPEMTRQSEERKPSPTPKPQANTRAGFSEGMRW